VSDWQAVLRKVSERVCAHGSLSNAEKSAAQYALALVEVELMKTQNASLNDKVWHWQGLKRRNS